MVVGADVDGREMGVEKRDFLMLIMIPDTFLVMWCFFPEITADYGILRSKFRSIFEIFPQFYIMVHNQQKVP